MLQQDLQPAMRFTLDHTLQDLEQYRRSKSPMKPNLSGSYSLQQDSCKTSGRTLKSKRTAVEKYHTSSAHGGKKHASVRAVSGDCGGVPLSSRRMGNCYWSYLPSRVSIAFRQYMDHLTQTFCLHGMSVVKALRKLARVVAHP